MQSYASEIEWLRSKVSEDPASMLYARLADRYLQVSEIGQAVECAEKGVSLHPHSATSRFVLAKCYYERKEYDKATKHLKEALAADPNYIAALYLHGDLLKNSGDAEHIRENYDRIIDIDPFDDAIQQKIYDLQFEPKIDAAKEDWTVDLSPDKRPLEEDSDALAAAAESDAEAKWLFETPASDRTAHYEDDPFADFEETGKDQTSLAEQELLTPGQSRAEYEEIQQEPFAETFAEPALDETFTAKRPASKVPESDSRNEAALDESIDDDFDIDRSKFKEEESKFTKLLDSIFSANLDEEERLANDRRNTPAQMPGDAIDDVRRPGPEEAMAEDDFEPLLDPDKLISAEEKILWHDRALRDEQSDLDELDDDMPEDFLTRQDELATSRPKTKNNDFSDFIESLDIQEEGTENDRFNHAKSDAAPADDVSSSDDRTDRMAPLRKADDWMNEWSEEESTPVEPAAKEPPPAKESSHIRDKGPVNKQRGKFITPTLGEIYAAQGQYAKAISVFETLIKNDPENDTYQLKLDYLKKKLAEQHN
ncbi:tetratricopeptide repeat protein [candidate division KSB1 bacterium]|nr:tetratricopeptide repeat protein [candidate division KSB1 bacterium]